MPTKTPTKIKFNKDSRIKKITTMDQNGNTTTSRMKYDKDGNLVKSVTKKHGDEIDAKGNVVDTKSRVVKKYDKDGTEISTKTTGNTTTKADTASDVNNTPAQNTTDATNTNTGNQIDDPDKPYPVKPEKAENTPVESKPVENKPTETTKEPVEKPDAPAEEAPKGDNPEGLGWFAKNWKTIAIAAGSAAVLIAIFKKMSEKSIKVRFKKCTNVLSRMQKDFTLSKNGLDMNAVLPGIGLRIMDKIAKVFTRVLKGKDAAGAEKGAIGLHPFCQTYKDEIKKDFELAQNAYNQISAAGDKSITSPKTESSQIVYSSFREALSSGVVNEESKPINEMALGTAISLGALALRGGMFVLSKLKNGKAAQGEDKAVQVTKESTREICYAIMNNFISKYINMEGLMQKMGINATSLSDLDASSVDKLKTVLEKYGSVTEQSATKQYARLKSMYDNMLRHYYHIGDGLIQNFEKYTKDANKDEKHANLMLASKEKLQAMWNRQKDIYNNNFSHVIVEIIKSDEYISYLNFIIEKVLPVFKSGLAGDADYVLDVMPKKDEYYVVRQTEGKDQVKDMESLGGNVALAKISSFDKESKKISFSLVGIIKSDIDYNEDGTATIKDKSMIDTSAYGNEKEQSVEGLDYGKWLALDPHLTSIDEKESEDKLPVHSEIYERKSDNGTILMMGVDTKGESSDKKSYDVMLFRVISVDGRPSEKGLSFIMTNPMNEDDFVKFAQEKNDDPKLNMGFSKSENQSDEITKSVLEFNKDHEKVDDVKKIAEKVNSLDSGEKTDDKNKHTVIYERKDSSTDLYIVALSITDNKNSDSGVVYDTISVYAKMLNGKESNSGISFRLTDSINGDKFKEFVEGTNSEAKLNMGFKESTDQSDNILKNLIGCANDSKGAASLDYVAENVNKFAVGNENKEKPHSKVYQRNDASIYTYVMAVDNNESGDNIFDTIITYTMDTVNKKGVIGGGAYKLNKPFTNDEFVNFVTSKNENAEINMGFEERTMDYESVVEYIYMLNRGLKELNSMEEVAKIINKTVSAGSQNSSNTNTVADKLYDQISAISSNIEKGAADFKNGTKDPKYIQTGISDNKGNEIMVEYEPDSSNENGIVLSLKIGNTYLHDPKSKTDLKYKCNLNSSDIQKAIKDICVIYKQAIQMSLVTDSVEYTSVMNERGCELTRNIIGVEGHYDYIVSESVWGDGTHANVNADLNAGIKTVRSFKTFESLSRYAKSNPSVKLMRYSDNASYVVPGPKNGIGVLTEANPLYESVILISVDDDNITNFGNAGIHKITEEDPND